MGFLARVGRTRRLWTRWAVDGLSTARHPGCPGCPGVMQHHVSRKHTVVGGPAKAANAAGRGHRHSGLPLHEGLSNILWCLFAFSMPQLKAERNSNENNPSFSQPVAVCRGYSSNLFSNKTSHEGNLNKPPIDLSFLWISVAAPAIVQLPLSAYSRGQHPTLRPAISHCSVDSVLYRKQAGQPT